MEDFGLFYASARQHWSGGSPYGPLIKPGTVAPSAGRNLNPPFVTVLFLPFGLLRPPLALAFWALLSLCALADILTIAVQEMRWKVLSLTGLASAVFLLAWAPAATLVITAQLALLVAWPLTRGWRAARRGAWKRAGWWIGTAAAMKPFLLVFIPYLALRRQWGAFLVAVLQLVALCVIGALVFGPQAYVAWARQFGDVTWQGHYMNASLWGVLDRVLQGSAAYRPLWRAPHWIGAVWALGAAAVLALTFWRLTRDRHADVDLSFGLLTTAALLSSPLGWVYYFWLAIAPIVAIVRRTAGPPSAIDVVAGLFVTTAVVWHASATIWLQPSGLATLTVGSAYFWALAATWSWLMTRGARPVSNAVRKDSEPCDSAYQAHPPFAVRSEPADRHTS